MRAVLCLLTVLCVALISPVRAEPNPDPKQDTTFADWTTYYYLNKDPSRMDEYLTWLLQAKLLEAGTSFAPISAFLAMVFMENPRQVPTWIKNHTFAGQSKDTMEGVLWMSGFGHLIPETFGEFPSFIQSNLPAPINLLNLPIKKAQDLDMMWGAFLATGHVGYVTKVIDVMDEGYPLTGDKTVDLLIRGAAEWSLAANIKQHELVNRLIRSEAKFRTGTVKKKLERIVAQYQANLHPFPHRDGDFSAGIVAEDGSTFAEYRRPSSEFIHVSDVSQAKRGQVVSVMVLFTGVQLKEDLSADVTYDFKVIDPKGHVYSGVDKKGLMGIKKKVGTRYFIYNSQAVPDIRFEPKDPLGHYKIIAEVHDNIGNKHVALSKVIKLSE